MIRRNLVGQICTHVVGILHATGRRLGYPHCCCHLVRPFQTAARASSAVDCAVSHSLGCHRAGCLLGTAQCHRSVGFFGRILCSCRSRCSIPSRTHTKIPSNLHTLRPPSASCHAVRLLGTPICSDFRFATTSKPTEATSATPRSRHLSYGLIYTRGAWTYLFVDLDPEVSDEDVQMKMGARLGACLPTSTSL